VYLTVICVLDTRIGRHTNKKNQEYTSRSW